MDLKGKQLEALQEALLSAFPSYPALEMLLRFELNARLGNIASPGPLTQVVYAIITWAEAEGRLEELIAGARSRNPGNEKLKRFALEISLTSDTPPEGRLESLVYSDVLERRQGAEGASPFQDPSEWRNQMARAERCVCCIETAPGKGRGTGFLIGPGVVMTNHHVISRISQTQSRTVSVRFDFHKDLNGNLVPSGKTYALADDWLIDSSPAEELDYALLRVEGAPEAENAQGAVRGYLIPQPHQFRVNEPLFILQHPLAAEIKVGLGFVTAYNPLHKRVTYNTNTEAGSSGSPCFTLDWELVAIHHFGYSQGNMGIPLSAIQERLRQKNVSI